MPAPASKPGDCQQEEYASSGAYYFGLLLGISPTCPVSRATRLTEPELIQFPGFVLSQEPACGRLMPRLAAVRSQAGSSRWREPNPCLHHQNLGSNRRAAGKRCAEHTCQSWSYSLNICQTRLCAQVFRGSAEMLCEVAVQAFGDVKGEGKNFPLPPKAFDTSADINHECELYGCLGNVPPQGRTLRQTS